MSVFWDAITESSHQNSGLSNSLHRIFGFASKFDVREICKYYIAQHICLHKLACTVEKCSQAKGVKKGSVQLIIALYSMVEKTRSGRHPRSSEKSFSTSTDGFRRHGASREAALDSKMLLKAVLIVCVVHTERKAECWQSAREFYFLPSPRGRSDSGQHGKGRGEPEGACLLWDLQGQGIRREQGSKRLTSLRRSIFWPALI